ncbi:uncharacterized protein N7515_003214 [Penicillium bovifimosum]|uniref:Condensation domain-containing protein n=1 Tax=Penicillium bovifimosum TaxID=126998 RepID=A0A9W9H637_9EURO|nr:uncharacterized protein N7515_003214 [Penicillium bovifimosum]KAJ5138366.1 hypothetical protein N7515_003214 [Penicillium bovifimosum]
MAFFETSLTCEQLKNRHQAAWWRTRGRRPVVGVSTDMENVTFEPHATVDAAKEWIAKTCHVVSRTTVTDVFLARSRQPVGAPMMTLVVDPIRGSRGCVLKMSHTLVSHETFRIIQDFITEMARPENELGIDTVFSPETWSDIRPNLPQSLAHAYSIHYHPTPADLEEVMKIQERAQARWSRTTIGIPLHPDWQTRPTRIHSKIVKFEPEEAVAALKSMKKLGVTLTAAFFACITSAIAQRYGSGDEEGAHLLFSGNARRWLDIEDGYGRGPITMGIIPGGMWIDSSEVDIRAKDKHGLTQLAKAIERRQGDDLASPHVMGLYDQMAPILAQGLAQPQDPAAFPTVGRPTLTSQGPLRDDRPAGPGQIQMSDFYTGGRNTDPNVCFGLHSFRDELRYSLIFDERFFVQDEVMQLAYAVAGLFRSLIAEELVPAKL